VRRTSPMRSRSTIVNALDAPARWTWATY